MIEFKEVTKAFGTMVAVDSVTFTVDKPQMIGVIGRSGAGKSTFLRLFNRPGRSSLMAPMCSV